jgi:hypothetical protein
MRYCCENTCDCPGLLPIIQVQQNFRLEILKRDVL